MTKYRAYKVADGQIMALIYLRLSDDETSILGTIAPVSGNIIAKFFAADLDDDSVVMELLLCIGVTRSSVGTHVQFEKIPA